MKLTTAATGIALAVFATSASAASYTFTFDDSLGDNHSSLEVESNEDSSVKVTLTANKYSLSGTSLSLDGAKQIDTNSYGIISENPGESGSPNHAVDSWGDDEIVNFDFGMDVIVTGLEISWGYSAVYYGPYKKAAAYVGIYDIFADGDFEGRYSGAFQDLTGLGLASILSVGTRTIYDSCDALYSGGKSYKECRLESSIKIKSITIEKPENVVPLPAAGFLLIGGLGGLAAMRRRKG